MISLESQELWEPGPDCWLGKEGGEKLRSSRGAVPVVAVVPLTTLPTTLPTARLLLLMTVFSFSLGGLAVSVGGKEDSKEDRYDGGYILGA